MEKYTVILHSLEQVQEFIHAIEKIPFHMDIGSGAVVVDAKSFQGIVAMGLNKELPLTIHGELTTEMKEKLKSGIVLTREQIFEAVWNMDSDSCHSSVVNVIYNLRKKIEPDSKNRLI